MTPEIHTLTEKEKETLRLLVHGYDAKSMARYLGLSVHTINERLRDARRKMAVSSSREAARQLREIEGGAPEFPGARSFGDAVPDTGMTETPSPARTPHPQRRTGWLIGGLFMSLGLALLIFSTLPGTADAPAAPLHVASAAAETAAAQSARQWLALVDAGDWNGSWDAAGQGLKSLNTSDRWAAVSQSVRTPLGAVVSRKLIGTDFVPAPPYGYRVMRFQTSYTNKARATETVSLALEDGGWRVVGYRID